MAHRKFGLKPMRYIPGGLVGILEDSCGLGSRTGGQEDDPQRHGGQTDISWLDAGEVDLQLDVA